jgi:hypothetical protein
MANKPILALRAMLPFLLVVLSCGGGSGIDPRFRIEAESPHLQQIARSINGSDLWEEYLDQVQPSRSSSSPVASFTLTMERKSFRSVGGDYDPGKIYVEFVAKSLRSGDLLIKQDPEVDLDPFMIGRFPANASREQIQELVFKAMEEKIYPYMDRWVNLAAIHAMGQESTYGSYFVSTLEKLASDSWASGDLKNAAREALRKIQG